MSIRSNSTVADRLLIVAHRISGDQCIPFSAEQLVISAWQEYPESFGLRGFLNEEGYPKYPDSNRIFAEIIGSKPLRKLGLLEKIADKTYRLTEAGRQRASVLIDQWAQDVPRQSLSRKLQEDIRRLLRSRASTKDGSGQRSRITFFDMCLFWGISPRSSAMHLEVKLAHIKKTLYQVKEYITSGTISLDGHNEATASDIDRLIELHFELQEIFAKELSIIRQRTDERQMV